MTGHRCDALCVCPVHWTPLIYWPAGDDHACQDPECVFAPGLRAVAGDLVAALDPPRFAPSKGQWTGRWGA